MFRAVIGLLVLFLILLSLPSFSSAPNSQDENLRAFDTTNFRFKSIDKEGLESIGGIWAVEQDSYGFMWFGGENGLARFDGYDVKVYRNQSEDNRGLSSSYVRDLLVDSEGNLWVATNYGLNLYIPESDQFTHFLHDPTDMNTISGNDIRCLVEDSDGFLWIGTGGYGLNRLNKASGFVDRFRHDPLISESLVSDVVYALDIDDSDNLWIGTESKGLDKLSLSSSFSSSDHIFQHFTHDPSNKHSISNNNIRSLLKDRLGNLWVGTEYGLNRLPPKESMFYRYYHNKKDSTSLSMDFVQSLSEDKDGNLWLSTSGEGVNLYNPSTDDFRRFQSTPRHSTGLHNNNIRTIFLGDDGNLWFGHFASGISLIDYYATAFTVFTHNPYLENTLNSNEITAVSEDDKGNLWIATVKGINYLDRQSGLVTRYKGNLEDATSISDSGVLGLLFDSKERLWVGFWLEGLNILDTYTGQFTHFKESDRQPHGLNADVVWTFLEDHNNTVWVGTNLGGLQYYSERDRVFKSLLVLPYEEGGLQCLSVFKVFEDSENHLWVGCADGVYVKRKGQKTFKHYYHIDSDSRTISANHIWSINEDSNGNVWIGTQGGGVNLYNKNTDNFTAYRAKDGLADDLVTGIVEDQEGFIWFSTGKGLSQFDLTSKVFKNYSKRHGMVGDVFNRSAFIKTSDNELVLGTKDGLSIFNPQRLPADIVAPRVEITGFKVFNEEVSPRDSRHLLDQSIQSTDLVALSYNQSSISFRFAALHYQMPSDVEYAYMLEGFDTQWNYVGDRRRAYYTNLDPGSYRFKVKAANGQGVWNELGDTLDVTIRYPWWKKWWAYLFYFLVVSLLLFLLIEVFWQHKLAENERRVSKQLRELDKVKDVFLANTSHELRTPLNGIIGLSESLKEGMAGKLPKAAVDYLDMITVSGKRLSHLVNDILDFSKLRERKLTLKKTPVDIYSLTEVVITLFLPLLKGKNIQLISELSSDLPLVMADENRLQQILYNLIGNAVKFTDSGSVTVSAYVVEGYLCISVIDTGVGISRDKYEAVFDLYEQVDSSENYASLGTGLGLTVTKQLVELHGGTIKVDSVIGKGSCFVFTLPLPLTTDKPIVLSEYTGSAVSPRMSQASLFHPVGDPVRRDAASVNEGGYHILVVDDEPVNRMVLEGFLKLRNYRVTECSGGQEALNLLQEDNDVDLVLLDVMMPRISGFETCKRIREWYTQAELPIIFLTARPLMSDSQVGFSVGGNDFLTKPIAKEELLSRVETHIRLAVSG